MSDVRHAGIIRRLWQETPSLWGLLLEVEPTVAEAYSVPGQYAVFHPSPDEKLFMAIASAPGEASSLEFLLGPAARDKLDPKDGASIQLDLPAGKGFPIEDAVGKDVLLFAVGSGMSAIRSALETIRNRRAEFGRVTLYAGAHTLADHPYRAFEAEWKADDIAIVRAVSKPWVQDLFRASPVPVDDALAFVIGMKDMFAGVKAALVEAGMPEERICANF